ncbi:UvrD-like helicase, ATP-binding domain, P-loop containing nucleoside triphosphate hydrolase [Tanacetum coccineum]
MYNEPMKWLISYSKICGKKLTMNQRLRKTLTKIKHKLLQLQDGTMTGCVLCFRARDAPTIVDQYVTKPIKSQAKLTNCVLALRAVNVIDVNVGSSRIRKKSRNLGVPRCWPASQEIIQFCHLVNDKGHNEESVNSGGGKNCVENSKVSDSLLLKKFYSLSYEVVCHLLSGKEVDLPMQLNDEQMDVLLFSKSSFLIGRSGTGKTTILTTKLFQNEEHFFKGAKRIYVAKSRQIEMLSMWDSSENSFNGADFTSEFNDIPDTFIEIPKKIYPLVITFHKFLMMLDGTLGNSFFERFLEARESHVALQAFIRVKRKEIVYTLFKIYEKIKSERGDSDLGDFVNGINQRLSNGNYEGDLMDFVYIDEVQDLSIRQISLFKYICQNVEEGFMFAGDTTQTIARVDNLEPETSPIPGEAPTLLESCHDENAIVTIFGGSRSGVEIMGFGAEQVILVRDDHARTEITEYVGRKALVLTILECKGLEFQESCNPRTHMRSVLVSLGFLSTVYETSESEGVTWAVLVAGSKGRKNYRFEADISGAYHVLKRGGKDVYSGVPKHYTSKDVTVENFLAVLAGDEKTVSAKEVVKQLLRITFSSTTPLDIVLGHHFTRPYPENGKFCLLFYENNFIRQCDMKEMEIQYGGNWPKLLRASADQILGTNHESYLGYLKEATGMYESVGKLEYAALCCYDLGEYGRAGRLCLAIIGAFRSNKRQTCGKMDAAEECFSLAGYYSDAAEAYANEISFPTVCQFAKRENFLIEGCCRNQESLHFTIVEPRNKIRELVSDIKKRTKTNAKRTKPSTGME